MTHTSKRRPISIVEDDRAFVTKLLYLTGDLNAFKGAGLYTGASCTVVRRPQAGAYLNLVESATLVDSPRVVSFRLRGDDYTSVVAVPMFVPLSRLYYLPMTLDFVHLDISLLIGSDVL